MIFGESGGPVQDVFPLMAGGDAANATNADAVIAYAAATKANYAGAASAAGNNNAGAAADSQAHAICGVAWSYSSAPTGGRLIVADGATTVLDLDITAAGPNQVYFPKPRKGTAGNAMTITLKAAGVGIVGKVNCLGHMLCN